MNRSLPENDVDNLTALSADSATIAGVRRFGRRVRIREKDQELFAVMLGGEKRAGDWVFDGQVNFSRGYEEKPDEVEIRFRRNNRDGVFRYTFTDTYRLHVEQLAGASITAPASYSTFQELSSVSETGRETERGIGFNARRSLDLSMPVFVKLGVNYREKEKTSEADALEYSVPSSFTFASLAGEAPRYPYGFPVPRFDGLGVLANVTFSDSDADYPTRPGDSVRFIGQSDYVGNLGLTYEKQGFFARLALNFRSERLREDEPVGSDATSDLWVDDFAQLDFTTSYRMSKHWEIYAEMLNLTDEPFKVYQTGGKVPAQKRFVQVEEYGWTANFGLRWKL